MKRTGILGGTFDPPHLGHLIIAEEVRQKLGLEEVWFIPSYTPPHKDDAKARPENRVKMVELATASNPYFKVNTIELERAGNSYTYDTLAMLKKSHPSRDFYFIIGADMVEYLPHWHKIDALRELVHFVGVKRAGYHLASAYPIIEVDIPVIEISSTLLRKRLQKKKSVAHLTTEKVYGYMKEKRLYEKG
ncbi:nicotinate-nucleotide adenylyltransferase [Virgibacillus sp. YIM 98842]|jgi:nicotinate-nucleotide adenylyltransferase|uniref:nicotinate-nucleotide adenylyltransferase n=1 Tax=Virgibacillus sp. YIM 98842 TaxID=2663533 RepID=UPI0013DCC7FC|nr:nicotinate-nucleotide adenylyltransferase [Virgibacillus sp. YIM 98842]